MKFNDTKADFPWNRCIHELFEAQVERTPEASAVVSSISPECAEKEQLTYRELNQRANQVAHYLQELGVGPEVLVGICMERSVEMIVGLLGILKAGGAYVPLDSEYPQERLAFMLADSQVAVLVTQADLLTRLPECRAKVVCLDSEWDFIAQQSQQKPVSGVSPENLAYVIYTSGSTGQPKGVMIQHRSLVNYTEAASVEYELGPGDRVLQFASISWDTSVEEIYSCLTRGATLVLRTPSMLDSVSTFQQKCREWGLTVLNLPTAYWHELTAHLSPTEALAFSPPLRLVIIGGEKALPERLVTWQKYVGQQVRLVNTYGLTEATAVTTVGELSGAVETDTSGREVPIGRPIRNIQTYVLDQDLRLVPIGVVGELYIGGVGLARGYLNRPELTAERFIPHPFSQTPGARLYKTGDLVRYRADGNLEFGGRLDHQVKLRGYRIELGEIEAVLRQAEGVREAVVLVREDRPGDQRLVGYVVLAEAAEVRESGLRAEVGEKLPGYMVPSVIMQLEALPLTPNGKVDRLVLPVPDRLRPELAEALVAPYHPVEEVVVKIWTDVLGLEQIGIHDNFFELGGHSLLATRIISRVREALGVELSLRSLFEAPTVAGLAERIEATYPASSGLQAPPITVVPRDKPLRLSFAQERLWFLDRLKPDSSVYNISTAVRLKGFLNVAALEQSLDEIVRRHETLRTSFPILEGQSIQVIGGWVPGREAWRIIGVDLQELPQVERETKTVRLASEEARKPFDLAQSPLWRITLLRLSAVEHVLLLTMHHIISDEWSLGVLVRELELLYEAFSKGGVSPLPELPIQYADFAHWQRQWLQGEVLEAQLNYWKQQLDGYPPALELPTNRPRPAIQSFRGASQSLLLPPALAKALRTFSQQEGVTLFMTLLAAFETLLYRYTGQVDILVGSPIANRARAEVEGLIGFFVNTLIVRTDLSGDPSFRDLVRRVREVALEAYTHQDLPFEMLVKELQPERDLSRNPLFQVMFAFQDSAPMPALRLLDLAVSPLEVDSGTAVFDLTLFVEHTEQELKGILEYNTDLFDAATMGRMLGHFQTLLEGVVANPEQRLAELPLLTAAEQRQLLVKWNDTRLDYPKNSCFQQLFEAQVERTPEAIAVVFPATGAENDEVEQLTYHELHCRANQVAHYLRTLGVGPEVLVGICVERSVEMVVGLLGILKSGGGYVPLDPEYPQERLAFMVKDAQVTVLLTQQRLLAGLPKTQTWVICLDTDWEQIAQESEGTPVNQARADNLAYVIYTSGSTGKPKGVLIPQRGLVNYLAWCTQAYPVEAGEGAPVHSSISFDLTITSLFAPLLVGRQVYLLPNQDEVDVLYTALHTRTNFSLVKLTPTHLELVSQQLTRQEAAGRTRAFIIGGENLLAESIAFWQDAAPDTILVNEYGPTETVVGCCVYQIPRGQRQSGAIPIGRPIANTELYVLDSNLRLVPIGVVGELYIGGVGLARGYLNRPELTAERFIPHPFSQTPGARLYKTGDLVRYRADGNLEFGGRLDHQVKLRGYRIELGEIEAVLRQAEGVREAVVVVREDRPGDQRLVGYVVLAGEAEVRESGLRAEVGEKLPGYMVPSVIMRLEALPLTPNGKLDRLALPVPDQAVYELESAFVLPQDRLELQLTKLWEQVLNIRPIGVRDNFFELGGHSLLAVRLFAQIEQLFGQKLPVATLFQAPTIEQLAGVLRQEGLSERWSSLVAIQPGGSRSPFFCIHGMGGGILDYTNLARSLGPDQPFYGLQERGLNGLHEPFTQIEAMAAHYIEEIRNLQSEGPYFLGGYCFGGTVAFEVARQLQAQGYQVGLLAIIDNTAPNFSYDQFSWQPGTVIKFFRNLPYWLSHFLHLSPDQMLARLRRKAKLAKQKVTNIFDPPTIEHSWVDIEEIIDDDLSQIPKEHHKLLMAHYLALINYQPQIYPGRITLFRTRRESLLGPFDAEMGWGRLATEGVEIKEISGFHAAFLQQPYVQSLAKQLRRCLDEAQRAR